MDIAAWRQTVRSPRFVELDQIVAKSGISTVCRRTQCPNVHECWLDGQAAVWLGSDSGAPNRSTVSAKASGSPLVDGDEPRRIAAGLTQMDLRSVTVAGVRPDLPDAGAWLLAQTGREVRRALPSVPITLQVSDFGGKSRLVAEVIEMRPRVFSHSIEVVPRLFKLARPGFDYQRSLSVLEQASSAGLITQSHLSLGLGETIEEVTATLSDLRAADCDLLTIGQYMPPSGGSPAAQRWIKPPEFENVTALARRLGFSGVIAASAVRACFQAAQLFAQIPARRT